MSVGAGTADNLRIQRMSQGALTKTPRHTPRLGLLTAVLRQVSRTKPRHLTEDLVRLTVPARCTRGGQIRPGEELIQDVSRIHPHTSTLPPTRGREQGSARPHQERSDPGPASGRGELSGDVVEQRPALFGGKFVVCSRQSPNPSHLVFYPSAMKVARR